MYYHDGIGEYVNAEQEAGDNSYRFSGGDFQVAEKAKNEGLTRLYTTTSIENDGVINFYCDGNKLFVGEICDNSKEYYYTTAYNEYKQYKTLDEALNQAVKDGYLVNKNIKNYVCFGPGAESDECLEDNLYRIIGVFDGQIKLIKYEYADTTMLGTDGNYLQTDSSLFWSGMRKKGNTVLRYYWNNDNTNNLISDWSLSKLNTINLNLNFWNYLTNNWQNKISNFKWQVGGNTWESMGIQTVKNAYTNEMVTPIENKTYQDEIGLMYVSDYMYAIDPKDWKNIGYDDSYSSADYRALKGDNWMYMGWAEWTISRQSNDINYAFNINNHGCVSYDYINGHMGVRPVFYLNSDVQIYEGHAGTASDPYRIVI